jgi:signal transduction histidine kinase
VDDLDLTIKEIRSTIYALQTPMAGGTTLRSRILEVVDEAAERLGHAPALRLGGLIDTNVSSYLGDQLIAVLRETLSNVVRHAQATNVSVDIQVRGAADGQELVATVTDDGVGLPDGGRRSGLANLAERAAKVGGQFRTQQGPDGRGTEICWQAPLAD